ADASPGDGGDGGSSGCPAPAAGGSPTPVTVDPATTPRFAAGGDEGSTYGVFDPSLVWPTGSVAGFVSYTSLEASGLLTRIAATGDGTSFGYVADANKDTDVSVATTDSSVCGAATCNGLLVHETSSLVYDGNDSDASRRFKLFDYSYVIVPGAQPPAQHTWGYIGLYTAQAPGNGWSAGAKAVGWSSSADAVSSQGAATVLSTVAELQDCAAFTEPAALVDAASGALYLALGCATGASSRVVLLKSGDHAATFTYAGLLLSAADGTSLGSTQPGVMPTDFFQDGGATYLIVSTLGTTPTVQYAPSGYTSCTTVLVDDLATAKVHRDAGGAPVIVRKLVAPGGAFAGACAFKPQFAAGYLVPEVIASSPAMPDVVLRSGITCP
ncbi:MAG: hypothetical protein ACRELB_24280, partial [Polyangiaceae bacterium]